MMDPAAFDLLSKASATLGAGLLLWPLIRKLRGLETPEEAEARSKLRSREWWAGFVLVCLALLFQRLAMQGA
jgi:hypothetical protein